MVTYSIRILHEMVRMMVMMMRRRRMDFPASVPATDFNATSTVPEVDFAIDKI